MPPFDSFSKKLSIPFFVLYLSLSGQIPIERLDDCFLSGAVSSSGKVLVPHLSKEFFLKVESYVKKHRLFPFKYIGSINSQIPEGTRLLPIEDLFERFSELEITLVNEKSIA